VPLNHPVPSTVVSRACMVQALDRLVDRCILD